MAAVAAAAAAAAITAVTITANTDFRSNKHALNNLP